MSYGKMAQVYDRLMADAPYGQWEAYTSHMLNTYHPNANRILDLGCGTGEITRRLHDKGFSMTGVDLSEDMLTIAEQQSPSSIQWLHQDITKLEGLADYDCVISFCDVINYLTEEEQVKETISNAYEALSDSGVFLFDVHSVEHVTEDLYGQTFAEVYDDLSYIWFCDPDEQPNSVIHDLTFFVQDHNQYQRFDEQHKQRAYPVQELKQWIQEAGFTLVQIHADFETTPTEKGERLFFVCKK